MIELIISAFVALTAALVGLLRLVVSLFGLLLEAIVFGAEYLATKPKGGESRFSGKRILVATIPVVLVLLMIATLLGIFHGQGQGQRQRREPGPNPRAAIAAPREEGEIVPGFRAKVEQAVRDRAKREVGNRWLKRSPSEPQ